MTTLLIFLAVLAVLVISHEWGHFIVARWNGIKVDEFGFGFPPRIFGVRRLKNEKRWQFVWRNNDPAPGPATLYSLNLIPLGGFVKIKGEDADENSANDPDSFSVKKAWQKTSVLVAGVLMNVIVGWLLLSLSFMIGLPTEASLGVALTNRHLDVVEVLPNTPAAAAGIMPGDSIAAVDGVKNPTVTDFQKYINDHRTDVVTVTLERGKQEMTKKIHPIIYPDTGQGGIGVAIADVGLVKYPWYAALYHGLQSTGAFLMLIVGGLWAVLVALFSGHASASDVSGPVGLAVMTSQAAHLGFSYLLQFTALLSLNLAVLNILPIPALDGGRLLFVIINKFRRKKIAAHTEQLVHTISFVVLMLLVILITVNDIGTFHNNLIGFFKRSI